MLLDVTTAEFCTIRLALIGWATRCEAEAKSMEKLATHFPDEPDTIAKCHANAAASRSMGAEASALRDRLKVA